MKLRMRRNSIRLRLTRGEIAQLVDTGQVEEAVEFPSGALRYRIELSRLALDVTATLVETAICIIVPERAAHRWISSSEAGIEARCGALDLLIEKDFQCEHGLPDEDAFSRQDFPHGQNKAGLKVLVKELS